MWRYERWNLNGNLFPPFMQIDALYLWILEFSLSSDFFLSTARELQSGFEFSSSLSKTTKGSKQNCIKICFSGWASAKGSRIFHYLLTISREHCIDKPLNERRLTTNNFSSTQDNKQPNQQNVFPRFRFPFFLSLPSIFITRDRFAHRSTDYRIFCFWLNHARDLCSLYSISIKSDICGCAWVIFVPQFLEHGDCYEMLWGEMMTENWDKRFRSSQMLRLDWMNESFIYFPNRQT